MLLLWLGQIILKNSYAFTAYGYLVSDISMNSLQHSLTRKLPWRERLNLQTQPDKLGMSALTPAFKICCKSRIVVFITSVWSMARTASRTSVLLVRSTVRTWGLPMNVSAYGCWEEIWGPTCLDRNLIMF